MNGPQQLLVAVIATAGLAAGALGQQSQPSSGPRAVNLFVAADGDDANPGLQTKPWKTIQKAADTMAPGDTVTVLEGKYVDQRVSVTKSGKPGLPITFQAKGTAVLKGFKITADWITIRGFEIAGTNRRTCRNEALERRMC